MTLERAQAGSRLPSLARHRRRRLGLEAACGVDIVAAATARAFPVVRFVTHNALVGVN